jgi:hypothetical protein
VVAREAFVGADTGGLAGGLEIGIAGITRSLLGAFGTGAFAAFGDPEAALAAEGREDEEVFTGVAFCGGEATAVVPLTSGTDGFDSAGGVGCPWPEANGAGLVLLLVGRLVTLSPTGSSEVGFGMFTVG